MPRSHAHGAPQRPFDRLADHLTALRRAARLTQRALAQTAHISRGAVQRAESGTAAPSTHVLDAYVRACGGGPAETARAHLLRNRGRTTQRDRLHTLKAPAPPLIHTEDDLGAALAAAYERAGAPCLSNARLTPGQKPLPRTTAWRIINRKGLPATTAQLVTFLTACGTRPAEHRPYINAYHRITAKRAVRPVPPRARRIPSQITGATSPAEIRRILEQLPEGLHGELLAATTQLASREARRNGAAVPDLVTATQLMSHGIGLGPEGPFDPMRRAANHGAGSLTRSPDGRTVVFEAKSYYQHRPGQPPEALRTRASQPPPPRPAPVGPEPRTPSPASGGATPGHHGARPPRPTDAVQHRAPGAPIPHPSQGPRQTPNAGHKPGPAVGRQREAP
ncbi:helix-turn-helix transcriptional regulator [Streptomyces sp. NPDC002589]|uniref:helix-turn-helix domain-containing protein n=1 Tax=Streptomyces sp. NPDC002589 TaxID=3154420 RepID=UPI00332B5954